MSAMQRPGIVLLGGSLKTVEHVSRGAEQAGFGSVWTTDFYERSAMVSLAVMAQATRQATIGSAIAYGVGRSPLVLSAEARDIDELCGGRLILGLGTGTRTMQRDWHGIDPAAPAVRMEELIPLLRRIWAMDQAGVEHDGRFYHLRLRPTVDVNPPLRPAIPVYLAGVNARMIRAAGRVADGLVGHPLATPEYLDAVARPALAAGAEDAGRQPGEVKVAGYVICAIHDRSAVARDEARAQIAFYSVVRTYRPILELHGFASHAEEIRAAWDRRDRAAMLAAVPDAMVDAMACAGTSEEVRDQFAARFSGVYDSALLYSPSFGLSQQRLTENVDAILDTFSA
jgi:probable F420-dependent oxidoreductase